MTEGNPETVLRPLRDRIDAIDDKLVDLLADRMRCVDDVIGVKRQHGIPGRLEDRVEEVVARVRKRASLAGGPPDLAELLWRRMIDWVIEYEDGHLDAGR